MKSKWNVIRAGITGCMAASLLAACSDGRGMGGFKSFRSTPEQRAEWLAKNGGDQPVADNTNNDGLDTKNDGTIDPGTLQEGPGTDNKTGDQTTTTPDQPVTDKPATDTQAPPPAQDLLHEFASEEAKTQVLTELNQTPAEDPAQQRVVNQADLIVANDAALNGATDATAASLIQGISIFVEGEANARTLSLDAVVKVGADIRTLHVAQAPLNKVTGDGQTLNMPIILKTVDTVQEVQAGDKVYVMGTCKDTACNGIQVRVEFALDSGNKAAAVFLIQLTGEGYAITHSNIGEPKDFATAFAAAGGKAAPEIPKEEATDQGTAPDATEKPADTAATDQPAADQPATDQPAAKPVLEDTRAEAIREHREALEAAKPKTDVANVGAIVDGTNSVTAKPVDGPGVGVLDPSADTRAEAIKDNRAAQADAAAYKQARDLAIRNGVLAQWEAQQRAKGLPVAPKDPAGPPATVTTDANATARAAQKKAGAYPGAGAPVQPKLTTQSTTTAMVDTRAEAIKEQRAAQAEAARLKAERDLAIRNGVLAQYQAKQRAAAEKERARLAALRRAEAQKKAGAYPGAKAK